MLNEVFTGGLSSYSIVNMVMTHLLCMGYQLPSLPGPVGNGPGFWGSLVPAPEQPEEDVGELLLSFLDHFGSSFNYALNAVSVGQVHEQLQLVENHKCTLHVGRMLGLHAVCTDTRDPFCSHPKSPFPLPSPLPHKGCSQHWQALSFSLNTC